MDSVRKKRIDDRGYIRKDLVTYECTLYWFRNVYDNGSKWYPFQTTFRGEVICVVLPMYLCLSQNARQYLPLYLTKSMNGCWLIHTK